jgi:DUF971 family protein
MHPTKLDITGDSELLIEWSDGTRRRYSFEQLSDACPCANCVEARAARAASSSPLDVVSGKALPPLKLRAMTPVGTYAYKIQFDGGCETGIYRFERLRQLGEEVK